MALQQIGGVGGPGPGVTPLDGGRLRLDALFRPDDGPSFADTLKGMLGEVERVQEAANDAIGAFVRGEPVELHQVMAATEEAGIALEMLIEIRNKFTEAYRSVINMQS